MSNEKTVKATKVVTGEVRFSYANVWEAKAAPGSTEKKFSSAILIPKKDKATLARINAAIEAAKADGIANKWGGKLPKKLKLPLRDGDEEKDGDAVYAGHYFINANNKNQPGIIDKSGNQIIERNEFYSGVYGKASLNFYPFNTNGATGVGVSLNNIMKTKDGENLGGGSTAEEDFADEIEVDDDL